jgi:serine protease Do
MADNDLRMGLTRFGRGRTIALSIAGLGLGLVVSIWGTDPGRTYAAAPTAASVSPNARTQTQPPSPRADHVAIGADENAQEISDSDSPELVALQTKFETVAQKVAPAVVSISAAETASDVDATVRTDEMNPQRLQTVLDKTTRTIGSGFIIDSDGFIVTNEHVTEDSQQYWVTTDDHKVYPAIVVGADPRADLAVLKIPATHLPTVRFASTSCQRGAWAITMGNPYGLATEGQMAMSVGVISATGRSLPRLASREDRLYSNLIQTTAQINPGNSGGPLFDLDGYVVGIDTAVILPQKQTNGIGFAIPVTPESMAEIRELKEGREVAYAYLGVTVSTPTVDQRQQASLSAPIAVHVESVEPNSPADSVGGLKAGDLIVAINGEVVTDTERFVRLIGESPIGRPVPVAIVRDGKGRTLKLRLAKRSVQYAVSNQNQRMHWRGMELGPVPMNWPGSSRDEQHRAGVLVVGIQDDSPLKKQGVSAGMVITAIAGHPVASMLEMQRILNDVPAEQCTVETAAETTAELATARK